MGSLVGKMLSRILGRELGPLLVVHDQFAIKRISL